MALPVPLLCVRALSKEYRIGVPGHIATHFVLRNVDLDVYTHECVALVGPPRAGKSTLLLCLAGLLHPTTGLIHWNLSSDVPGSASNVVYVPEQPAYYGFLTLIEALGYYTPTACSADTSVSRASHGRCAHANPSGVTDPDRTARIEAALERTGLYASRSHSVSSLSPSAMQRLRIAHALVSTPRVILLDEVPDDIDRSTFTDIQRIITELVASQILVLLATRSELVASQLATRLIRFPPPWSGAHPLPRIAEARTLRKKAGKDGTSS